MKSIWNFAFIFGLIAEIFGISFLVSQFIAIKICTEHTEGMITMSYRTIKGIDLPYSVLTYTANGVEYTGPFAVSENIAPGDVVTVYYNPTNPEKVYILEEKSNSLIVGIAFAAGGIVFMLTGYGVRLGLIEGRYRRPFERW